MRRWLPFVLLLFCASVHAQSLDSYGGDSLHACAGTLLTGGAIPGATGFFYLYKDSNLIHIMYCDPLGNRFWQTGVEVVDYGGGPYVGIIGAKYGAFGSATGWEAIQTTRLKAMGFNTVGEYSRTYMFDPHGQQPNPIPFIPTISPGLYDTTGVKDPFASLPPKWDTFGGYRGFGGIDLYDPIWTGLGTGVGGSMIDCPSYFGFTCAAMDASPYMLATGMDDISRPGQIYTGQGTYIIAVSSPWEQFENSFHFSRKQVFTTPTMYIKQTWANWLCGTRYANLAALNAAWGSTYTTCASTATTAGAETIGTGDGVTTSFSTTFLHTPVDPTSIGIKVAGVLQGGDVPWFNATQCTQLSGVGCIQSATGNINGGSVTYSTGAITVTFSAAPALGVAITATYQYLGWPKAMMVSISYNQLGTDNFTRANSNPIGGNWTTQPSSGAIKLLSNAAAPTVNSTFNVAYYNAASWTADQYSEVTVGALPSGSGAVDAVVRASTSTNSHYGCLALGVAGGSVTIRIDKVIAGADTTITSTTATVNTGDIVRCEVQGTNLTFKLNTGSGFVTKLTTSDTALSSGSAGIGFFSTGAETITTWTGGSVVATQTSGTGVLDEDGTSSWWPAGDPTTRAAFPDPPVGTIQTDMDLFLNIMTIQYTKPVHDWLKSNFPHHLVGSLNPSGGSIRNQAYNGIAAYADVIVVGNSTLNDGSIIMGQTAYNSSAIAQYDTSRTPIYIAIYSTAEPDSQYKGTTCPYNTIICFPTQNTKGIFYQSQANLAWNLKGSDGYGFVAGIEYWQYTDNSSEQGAYGLISLNDNMYGYPPSCPTKREDRNSSITDCYGFTTTAETNNYGNFVNSGVVCGNYVWLGIPCNNTAVSAPSRGRLP